MEHSTGEIRGRTIYLSTYIYIYILAQIQTLCSSLRRSMWLTLLFLCITLDEVLAMAGVGLTAAAVFMMQRPVYPAAGHTLEPGGVPAVLYPPSSHSAKGRLACQYASCERTFLHECHRARHYQCSAHGPTAPVARRIRKRHNYTFSRKRDLLLELDGLIAAGAYSPMVLLETRTGVSRKNIWRWNRDRVTIFSRAISYGTSKLRKYRPQQGKYHDAEVELYALFLHRRRYCICS
jgi:nitrate reductase NapE component